MLPLGVFTILLDTYSNSGARHSLISCVILHCMLCCWSRRVCGKTWIVLSAALTTRWAVMSYRDFRSICVGNFKMIIGG